MVNNCFDSAVACDYAENRYNIIYSVLEVFLDYTQQNKYNIRNYKYRTFGSLSRNFRPSRGPRFNIDCIHDGFLVWLFNTGIAAGKLARLCRCRDGFIVTVF